MKLSFVRLASIIAAAIVLLTLAVPAGAQYGEDPPESVVVGAGVATFEGKFFRSYTAPDKIESPFLLYVIGTDKDGEPFEFVVARVTDDYEGLTWTLNGIDMQPGSAYTIEARFETGTDLSTQVLGIEQLPTTGNDSRGLIGIGMVLTVVGGSLFYGSRVGRRNVAV